MKLLKYPKQLHDGNLGACAAIHDRLVTVGSERVSVWDTKQLLDAAMGKSSANELSELFSSKGDFNNEKLCYVFATDKKLFVGTDHALFYADSWLETREKMVFNSVYRVEPPSTITDIKYDPLNHILFILVSLTSKKNVAILYEGRTCTRLAEILLPTKPMTGIIDPMGQIFTIVGADHSISIYQYNSKGSYKLVHQLPQYVQIDPVHYTVTMSPQADTIPIINSLKNSTPSVVLLDRNNEFKVSTTLVGYDSKCKILKFSPNLYEKTNKTGTTQYNLLASSGNENGSVAVWNTKRARPLFNAAGIAKTFINDLAWNDDGMGLFAVSDDGYMYVFAFQEKELGQVLPQEETVKLQASIKKLEPLPTEELKPLHDIKPKSSGGSSVNLSLNPTTVTKSGKKKVVPTTIQSTSMEFNPPSYSVPKDLKRKPKDEETMVNGKKQKKDVDPMDFLDTNILMPNISFSKLRLATPKIRVSFQYSPVHNKNLLFDVKNGTGNEQKPTSISLLLKEPEQDRMIFQDFIPKFVTLSSAGESFWACCTEDGTLYVYSDTGKRLLPPMIMGVPCSFLEACGKYLLCVTSMGQLYCWDIDCKRLKFPVNTVYPLLNPVLRYSDDILTRAENITMCTITKNGVPLLTLSNGDGYMFDCDMETWLLISDSWWAYGSQYWDMTNTNGVAVTTGSDKDDKKNRYWNPEAENLVGNVRSNKSSIVNYLESKTNDELSRKGRIRNLQKFAKTILMKEGFENLEDIVTLSHLENRVLVSLKLGEDQEFTRLLIVYCIRLGEMGYKNRLNDVLQWLYNNGNYKIEKIAGTTREELLKQILVACADIRQVQRVTVSYATALGLIDESL